MGENPLALNVCSNPKRRTVTAKLAKMLRRGLASAAILYLQVT